MKFFWKCVLGGAAAVLAAAVLRAPWIQDSLTAALEWIASIGIWAPLVFCLLYIFSCIFIVPGSILTLGAGFLFGVIRGSVLVSAASTLGATAAFLIGRYAAREWVVKKMSGRSNFQAIDRAVAQEGWKIVGLTRLSPVFPFNLLNYAYGLTQVSLRDYFLASWIGMLPGTVMYVYLGSLAGSLASVGSSQGSRSAGEWTLYGIGLAATIGVTIFVTRMARRALREKVEREGGGP